MTDVVAKTIYDEIKKIRGDQDKIQAYLKTLAETVVTISTNIATIATNTTPAEEPAADAET